MIRLEESLSRHNHFTAFHWIDALLAGKANRAQRIMRQLEAEGVELVILARTVQKELSQLLSMQQMLQSVPMVKDFAQFKVWQSKRPLYSAALNRLKMSDLRRLIQLLAKIELLVKTQYDESSWPLLHQLGAEMCQPPMKH